MESYPDSSVFQGTSVFSACLIMERCFKDVTKTFTVKLESFVRALESILLYYKKNDLREDATSIFLFIQRHSLFLLFDVNWRRDQAAGKHMIFMYGRLKSTLTQSEMSSTLVRDSMEYLITLSSNPWGDPVLNKLLQKEPCSDEEVLIFCRQEIGLVLMMRLERLVRYQRETEAINLMHTCLQCFRHHKSTTLFQKFLNYILYIEEVYLTLLVKKRKDLLFVEEVAKMELRKGFELVQRSLRSEQPLSLMFYKMKMTKTVLNTLLTKAILRPVSDETLFRNMIKEWFDLGPPASKFRLLNEMASTAISSHHIYLLAEVCVDRFGETEKERCVELYVRALTINLNELENLKFNHQHENVLESELQMSKGFLFLADYLNNYVMTSREIVLTAFSLNPTRECLDRLNSLARASRFLRFPRRVHRSEPEGTSLGRDYVIAMPEADVLGVSQELCGDLLNVISKPRFNVLNWRVGWTELKCRCERYLTRYKDARSEEKELE